MNSTYRIIAFLFAAILVTGCGGKKEWIVYEKTKGSEITSIENEDDNVLWYGTRRGVVRFDKLAGKGQVFDENQGLSDKNVRMVVIGGTSKIKYFATAIGLSTLDGANWGAYDIQNEGMPSNDITSVCLQGKTIWITTGAGVGKYDGKKWETINHTVGLLDDVANCVAAEASGRVWIGTASGLTSYDGKSWTVYDTTNSPIGSFSIKSVNLTPGGTVWVGTSRGLAKYDGSKWTFFTNETGLPDNFIKAVEVGSDGSVWVGTTKGLAKFDGSQWTVFRAGEHALPSNKISALRMDSRGNLWIGTEKDGLCVFKAGGVELDDSAG